MPKNYQPITLVCHLIKIMKEIMAECSLSFLKTIILQMKINMGLGRVIPHLWSYQNSTIK